MTVSIGSGVQIGTGTTGTVTVAVPPLQFTTPAVINSSSVPSSMQSVAVNSSGLFVAVGYTTNLTGLPLYATSTDGSTWTTPALMNGSSVNARMLSVTVNSSGLFVAVGYNGYNYPVYATSTDGST